jgi:hypothetical protein
MCSPTLSSGLQRLPFIIIHLCDVERLRLHYTQTVTKTYIGIYNTYSSIIRECGKALQPAVGLFQGATLAEVLEQQGPEQRRQLCPDVGWLWV